MLGVVALVLGTVGDVVSCVVCHFSSLVGSTVGAEVLVESVLVHPQPVSKVTPKIKDKVRMLIFFILLPPSFVVPVLLFPAVWVLDMEFYGKYRYNAIFSEFVQIILQSLF